MENPFRSLVCYLSCLYGGEFGSQPSDSDVFIYHDARLRIDGIKDINDGVTGCVRVIDGSLDGGKVATVGAYRIAGRHVCGSGR